MKKWNAFFAFCLIFTLLTGCRYLITPPSVNAVDQKLQANITDVQMIISFMKNSEYEDIYIHDISGTMLADLVTVEIPDDAVKDAVHLLLGNDVYKSIYKQGNTIKLLQWAGSSDIGCGIAYTINGIDPPEIQYMTQLLPLSAEGWYYYVSDFNTWRLEQGENHRA